MLVAVLMIFVVMSFTGVAVLNVSYLSHTASQETVDNIKLQYAVESSINQALWRINAGVDSLANTSYAGVTTVWDSTSQTLTVNVDKFQMESEIMLDLSEDTHFDRGIAAEESINLNGYEPGLGQDQQIRDNFQFLPDADIQYFLDNAVQVHTQSYYTWNNTVFQNGIHVFTGNHINLSSTEIHSGTLVFTGYDVEFMFNNDITAAPADSNGAYPALIFTNNSQNFDLYSPFGMETIIGAIYCKGNVNLYNGHISGPVVAKNVNLHANFAFSSDEHQDKYQWTHGFGHRSNYDWPKQIGRWRIHKWIKKNIQVS